MVVRVEYDCSNRVSIRRTGNRPSHAVAQGPGSLTPPRWHWPVCVCLSQVGVLLKWLNGSSCMVYSTDASSSLSYTAAGKFGYLQNKCRPTSLCNSGFAKLRHGTSIVASVANLVCGRSARDLLNWRLSAFDRLSSLSH